MTPSDCPHGFAQGSCEICRVLESDPPGPAVRRRSAPLQPRRTGRRLGVGVGVVAVGVVLVVVLQVVSAVWAALHLLQLVTVGAVAGWIGWRLGNLHGRRSEKESS